GLAPAAGLAPGLAEAGAAAINAGIAPCRLEAVRIPGAAMSRAASGASIGGGSLGERDGGESGIRTHEAVLAPTRFPIVLLQPLGHLSATSYTIARANADREAAYRGGRPHGKRLRCGVGASPRRSLPERIFRTACS